MDVNVFTIRSTLILPLALGLLLIAFPTQSSEEILEPHLQLIPVVQHHVGNDSRVDGEEETVEQGVGSAHVRSGVAAILLQVEHAALIKGLRYVVKVAEMVENTVAVYGEVGRVPGVGVPDAEDN